MMGSAATATVTPRSLENTAVIASRTTAESSTTRTWSGRWSRGLTASPHPAGRGSAGLAAGRLLPGMSVDRRDDAPDPVCQAVQGLRVPQEEVSPRRQVIQQPLDHAQPRLGIEVDENVAAEDQVEAVRHGVGIINEVETLEPDDGTDLRVDLHLPCLGARP